MASPFTTVPGSEPREQPDLGHVLEFMRLMWNVDHALQTRSKRMARTLGVTSPQRMVLRLVGRFPRMPAGQLSTILRIHPSTLTGILKRLEARGLVERREDPHDARRALLVLTTKGKRIDVLRAGTVESAVERALEGLSSVQIHAARTALARMAEALEEPPRTERGRKAQRSPRPAGAQT